ncbi:MAG: type II toxin-antitoxin system Phd/YefM family antitoxin [Pseudomonadota bacterium]
MKAIPVFEAKNRFSELIAAVEHGDRVTITRRGVPVACLVAAAADESSQRERVASALERLRQIRAGVVLEGDLKAMARAGLD